MAFSSAPPPRSGLLLPPAVVQPFFLRFDPDDWHVMAFLKDHPDYEAVEAMLRARPDGGWAVRAIITRHDGIQIDHVNDPALLAAMSGATRDVVEREIEFAVDASGQRPAARLAFVSAAGEPIELQVFGLGPPDPRGAGLSDPGAHSSDASLPLMWRKASALAAEGTHTVVSGRRYEAPARELRAGLTAREGYLTAGHSLGVVRAGEVRMTRVATPARFEAGEEWRYEVDGEEQIWRIAEQTRYGELIVGRQAPLPELIFGRVQDDRFELVEVAVPDRTGLVMNFHDGRFDIGVEGNPGLVSGRLETDDNAIVLRPETPGWAISRPVKIAMMTSGEMLTVTTTIGPGL